MNEEKKQQPRVIVFSTPMCPHCRHAKQYLRSRGIAFTEVDVSRDAHAAQEMERMSGQQGVPVIRIDNHIVVGFDRPKIDRLLDLK
ncbi:MAG TPA: glutaredoxin domain-containing protein [Anaerolineae bacterium]|nr:glutaredoxin domain-containing protein [Anaerolineae bacterium]HQH38735.1 glutaredoxin domain-containing protein [Anaerolineae bacterium]